MTMQVAERQQAGLRLGNLSFINLFRRRGPEPRVGQPLQDTGVSADQRRTLIERWRNIHRTVQRYEGGVYPDGTPYAPGRTLYVLNNGFERPEQVMDDFETRWCQETVNAMFGDRTKSKEVLERGFGLGIMADFIYNKMKFLRGSHRIIELNREIFEDAKLWLGEKVTDAQASNIPTITTVINEAGDEEMHEYFPQGMHPERARADALKLVLINGDADEELLKFPPATFDLIFSDTHQLRPQERGVNDLLNVDGIRSRLKYGGRFTFCAFHRDSQEGDLDDNQRDRITPHFRYTMDTVPVVPPPHITYFQWPRRRLPIVVCERSRF